jgi:hypothetical protein
MAAKVDGDRLPPSVGHRRGGSAPRAAGLPAAVQEHHGRRKGIAEAVSDDAHAVNAVGCERFR